MVLYIPDVCIVNIQIEARQGKKMHPDVLNFRVLIDPNCEHDVVSVTEFSHRNHVFGAYVCLLFWQKSAYLIMSHVGPAPCPTRDAICAIIY